MPELSRISSESCRHVLPRTGRHLSASGEFEVTVKLDQACRRHFSSRRPVPGMARLHRRLLAWFLARDSLPRIDPLGDAAAPQSQTHGTFPETSSDRFGDSAEGSRPLTELHGEVFRPLRSPRTFVVHVHRELGTLVWPRPTLRGVLRASVKVAA
jgi:hypothetical protein